MLNRFAGSAEKKAASRRVPARRLGTPEDIAATIVFLASDRRISSPGKSSVSTAARPPYDLAS